MWKCSYASRDKKKGRAKGEVLGIKSGGTEAVQGKKGNFIGYTRNGKEEN